jgi:SAM-dependent methyltransferase
MPKQDWIDNSVQKVLERAGLYPTGRIRTVLDVGCGLSFKSQYVEAEVRVGVDIHRPFLEAIETRVPYAAVCADALDIGRLFLPRSFDLVLLLDLLEHIEKPDALRLLEMAETIARVAVIVETPRGYIPQNIDIWQKGGDAYQTHRCGWEPEEFTRRGYAVVERPYRMSDARRHTTETPPRDVVLIDAIRHREASLPRR